ncbi:cystathione beta-lyase [Pilibacter termitis]|uniref:cysteine-S-conjugate beta-lyase n=1 Tax=Pilibacter termitis TaxID=263852 RepID=A0A1T4QBI8_9ENTE|nr:MalY/PatB family protein [Pilibacter termitis]SKA01153.1 cystathione beta-lyase [Pilibacter termitis]
MEKFIETYKRERKNTNSLKWDLLEERYGDANLLPLWVADMDFATPIGVQEALRKKVDEGIFGYAIVPKDYFSAFDAWQKRHSGAKFEENWLYFSTGVVQALYHLIDCFTKSGDKILIQPPVYYPFFQAIERQNRTLLSSPLKNNNGNYEMDFKDLEQQFQTEDIKMMIFCSPHNPVGRVWREDELKRLIDLCEKYQVLLLSDEIHGDLIQPEYSFTSMISVAEKRQHDWLIVLNAPSKTFNLASLLNAHLFIPSEKRRNVFEKWKLAHWETEYSSLGQIAAMSAYQTGDEWLENILKIVRYNYELLKNQLSEAIPAIKIAELQGTYLAWLDCRNWIDEQEIKNYVQNLAGLAIDYGEWFSSDTKGFIRINLATTPEIIQKAINQLIMVENEK